MHPQHPHLFSNNTAIAAIATLTEHFERASAPLSSDSGRQRPGSKAYPAAAACSEAF